ncbi:hypothetical protein Bbelb_376030 [Branchiostoma belcheri]|nr:hypothetical protein Bbelb_376030 [Branchiostoma belcheri]
MWLDSTQHASLYQASKPRALRPAQQASLYQASGRCPGLQKERRGNIVTSQAQQNRPQVYPVARPGCNQTRALSRPVETGNQATMPDKPSRIAPKFTLSRGLAVTRLGP